jgi:AAA+ superfamily predicted ATPase
MEVSMGKSLDMAQDLVATIRSRPGMTVIVSREEKRVESYIFKACAAARYVPRTWDMGQGVADMTGRVLPEMKDPRTDEALDFDGLLELIRQRAEAGVDRGAWIIRDPAPYIAAQFAAKTVRSLRNLARSLPSMPQDNAQALILLTTQPNMLPPELAGHATVLNWPLPDREEIAQLLEKRLTDLPAEVRAEAQPSTAAEREAAIDAAIGLSGEETEACFAKSLVQFRRIDPLSVAREKKRVIAASKVLEWVDPLPGGLDSVGGLDNLKLWLNRHKMAYTPAAREYGLPVPRGIVLVGYSGCGKTMTAKATGTALEMPLVKFDPNAAKGKFVGDSERAIRDATDTIESLGKCIVWIDEIEKSLAGAVNGGADGGVSADQLGWLLTWMQERQSEGFLIVTSNDITKLPPEFLRKGRFDEVFWVDLPTARERAEILAATLRTKGRKADGIDLAAVAAATDKFTGAEVATLVPEAMFAAFADGGRDVTTADLVEAAGEVVPLSFTMAAQFAEMKRAMAGRAKLATTPDKSGAAQVAAAAGSRAIEL